VSWLLAAKTLSGNGVTIEAIDHQALRAIMRRHGRLEE
jgi:hypothetical protein